MFKFKMFLHGLLLCVLPVLLTWVSQFTEAMQLPGLQELWAEGLVVLSVILGYTLKLAWFGSSSVVSWLHGLLVAVLASGINAIIVIFQAGQWPTGQQWMGVASIAVGAGITYLVKVAKLGASTMNPATMATGAGLQPNSNSP